MSNVTYSVDDLQREVGVLFMECKVRGEREIQLLARIAELEGMLKDKVEPVKDE